MGYLPNDDVVITLVLIAWGPLSDTIVSNGFPYGAIEILSSIDDTLVVDFVNGNYFIPNQKLSIPKVRNPEKSGILKF